VFVASCGGSNPVAPSRRPAPVPAPPAPPPPPTAQIGGTWAGTLQYDRVDFDSPTLKRTVKSDISMSLTQDGRTVQGSFTLKDGSAGTVTGTITGVQFEGSLSMVLKIRPDCPYRGDFTGMIIQESFDWHGNFSTRCVFAGLGNVSLTASRTTQ
jgi:hypothetical protein